mmetsp:Transcript_1800/g.3868  ORF Transcript_1800/g.3868 Transcript_1800/m.3868 type:complete len:208 (+) Transcript_1800:90-713(+)
MTDQNKSHLKLVRSAKYWLFDLAIVLTIVATLALVYRSTLPTAPIAPECDEDNTMINANTAIPVTSPKASQQAPPMPPPVFHAGDLVEVFEPRIHPSLAFSAQIVQVFKRVDGSVKYIVKPGFGRPIDHQKFDPSRIRALGSFESNAEAMCNLGQELNSELTPCTVLEHIKSSNNYGVSFLKEDGALTHRIMNVARIRRVVLDDTNR